jgi:hypothetical protein
MATRYEIRGGWGSIRDMKQPEQREQETLRAEGESEGDRKNERVGIFGRGSEFDFQGLSI